MHLESNYLTTGSSRRGFISWPCHFSRRTAEHGRQKKVRADCDKLTSTVVHAYNRVLLSARLSCSPFEGEYQILRGASVMRSRVLGIKHTSVFQELSAKVHS